MLYTFHIFVLFSVKVNPHRMHLPSEFYYYTGKCNSSEENLQEIQNNFVQALNSSKFYEECRGVPECKAEFVSVSCGPTSSRKRRDSHVYKRSTGDAYIINFELLLPFEEVEGKTADDVFTEKENMLYQMSDVIQTEVDAGHFDIPDLIVDSDSFAVSYVQYKCGEGMMPRQESASCGNKDYPLLKMLFSFFFLYFPFFLFLFFYLK